MHLSTGLRGPFFSGAVILWTGNDRFAQESPATFSLLFWAQPFPKCLMHTQRWAQWVSVELRSRALRAPIQQPPTAPPKLSPHTTDAPSPFQAQREPRGLPASPWVSCHTHTVWVTVLNAFFMFLKCTHRALKGRRTKLLSQGGLFPPICLHNVPQSLCNAASSTQPCLSLCLLEWRTVPVLQSVPSDVVSHPRCFATATESLN